VLRHDITTEAVRRGLLIWYTPRLGGTLRTVMPTVQGDGAVGVTDHDGCEQEEQAMTTAASAAWPRLQLSLACFLPSR
jgi:hypothetical protein